MEAVYWFLIVIAGVLLLVGWHTNAYAYVCKSCGGTFSISFLTNLRSPHLWSGTYLRCPKCNEIHWCKTIKKS